MQEIRNVADRLVDLDIHLDVAMRNFRQQMAFAALEKSGSGRRKQNLCKAARMLDIHRNTLTRILKGR